MLVLETLPPVLTAAAAAAPNGDVVPVARQGLVLLQAMLESPVADVLRPSAVLGRAVHAVADAASSLASAAAACRVILSA